MLTGAHRGYDYQDLLVAIRLVDVVLGDAFDVVVDRKDAQGDRFDDLKISNVAGERESIQIKHTTRSEPLALNAFTSDERSLRLDRLVESAVASRASGPSNLSFRIILADGEPTDPELLRVLRPADGLPPFARGIASRRYKFDADAIWPSGDSGAVGRFDPFLILRSGNIARDDLVWLCERLVVEIEAPHASLDLTRPGEAEQVLLDRMQSDIGAGTYPNQHRPPVDVALAFVAAARAARMRTIDVSVQELLRRLQIRTDFGAVSRAHPVDVNVVIDRPAAIAQIVGEIENAAVSDNRAVLLLGPPGQGKSWACAAVGAVLSDRDWLVAEHYCFLGDSNVEREERVLIQSILGTLMQRIVDSDVGAASSLRPRFAVDDSSLTSVLDDLRSRHPERRVALVVDGLDHVTRVLGSTSDRSEPSRMVAQRLADLRIPQGTVLVVLSQPGEHLTPLRDSGARMLNVPALGNDELEAMATKLGLVAGDALTGAEREPDSFGIVAALARRSGGNALYATYLCREALRRAANAVTAADAIDALPTFDGSLRQYYTHLTRGLHDARVIAELLSLIEFSATRSDLKEMFPTLAHRVDAAVTHLGPVLNQSVGQGGVRIYHESFARFLREGFSSEPSAAAKLLELVAVWLKSKGFFDDARAYRFLLSTLARAGKFDEVLGTIDRNFVRLSVEHGFAARAVVANLGVYIECASNLGDWPAVARGVELARSAATYEHDNLEYAVQDLATALIGLTGVEHVAERLLFDGRPTVRARVGVQLCAVVDANGGTAPWEEYLDHLERESENDNTSYGETSDAAVYLSQIRGKLRLRANAGAPASAERIAEAIQGTRLPAKPLMDAICDVMGVGVAWNVAESSDRPGAYLFALAQRLDASGDDIEADRAALRCADFGPLRGAAAFLIGRSVPIERLVSDQVAARHELLRLTRLIQQREAQYDQTGNVEAWLDLCASAARVDPFGLNSAEALLDTDSWYGCWLRFAIELSRLESARPDDLAKGALHAVKGLTQVLEPFQGKIRTVDLLRMGDAITDTFRRLMDLLDDTVWDEAIDAFSKVSQETTATFRGEMVGPLRPDVLLELVVAVTRTPARRTAAEKLLQATLGERARRHYRDMAGFHLCGARLALQTGDDVAARARWSKACSMLTAYGWHKDITIYEILDSLESTASIDIGSMRSRMSALQPLCERLLHHTDGDETRHAIGQWWSLLARVDPCAASVLSAQALLSGVNLPSDLHERTRNSLWRAQAGKVDSIAALALRLSLSVRLEAADTAAFERAASLLPADEEQVARALLRLASARIDERKQKHPGSSSDDLAAEDDERIGQINASLLRVGEAPVSLANASTREPRSTRSDAREKAVISLEAVAKELFTEGFGPGGPGLFSALRTWRNQPFQLRPDSGLRERFHNIIGYRILELIEADRLQEAEQALLSVATGTSFGGESTLLDDLAQGLEIRGHVRLAVMAYTLVWTRTRGNGGWCFFGGETAIESLKRAAKLDPATTLEIIGREVHDLIVNSTYGVSGVTLALVHAFATVDFGSALSTKSGSARNMSFRVWDSAAEVIAARLPAIDDEPRPPDYSPGCSGSVTDLEVAFALATLAGISHPGREQKRRSLVALDLLLQRNNVAVADAVAAGLEMMTDGIAIAWILEVLDGSEHADRKIQRCVPMLTRYAKADQLALRAVARRLLARVQAPLGPLPVADPAPEIVLATRGQAVLLAGSDDEDENAGGVNDDDRTGALVDECAGPRLARAEIMLPGLRRAVCARFRRGPSEEQKQRMKLQLDALSGVRRRRVPDAFLAIEQFVEESIQLVAAGGRAALALAGRLEAEPSEWEDDLSTILALDDRLAVAVESVREPRSDLPRLQADKTGVSFRRYELRACRDVLCESHGHLRG